MSATQPNPRFEYSDMTELQARAYLTADFGLEEVDLWENRNHIKNYVDVLYYADAYGDLEDAILLQGFDKTLPERAHKGLLESGLDIYEAVNCNDLDTVCCPSCDTEMWDVEIGEGSGYTSHNWVDEYGNVPEFVEYVESPDGRYWNADWQEGDSPVLCWACSHDIWDDFPRTLADNGSVVVHYGESDEVSAFSVWNGMVRWDFMDRGGRNSKWTDLFWLPGDEVDVAVAFANGDTTTYLNGVGWDEIAEETAMDALPDGVSSLAARREYRWLAGKWSEGEEPHPDLGFTYIIDHATFGNPSFWVADDNRDELMAAITDRIQERMAR